MSEALIRATVEALRRGDGHGARAQFEALMAASPPGSRLPWLTMAQACRMTGDVAAETRALEAVLRDEPRNLAGLLLMGDRKQRDGDDRAATAFYQSALANAGASPPPSLQPLLQAAQRYLAQAGARFEAHLTAALTDDAGGLAGGGRMQAALDLLLGRTQLYLQQPSMFYFPGLPQRQFYERDEFPWLAAVEAATPAIRAEFEAVLAGGDTGFQPYVEAVPDRPAPRHSLLDDPNWSAFFLWKDGRLVEENARRCPATMAAFSDVPAPHIAGWSPMLLFSVLRPGTHIKPHCGVLNTRLICHLPIVVPPGCGLRVGNETREWREGETLIFDDSIEHEAWNRGTSVRAVLLFEIWRPEIVEAERAALTKVLEAIRDYRGSPE